MEIPDFHTHHNTFKSFKTYSLSREDMISRVFPSMFSVGIHPWWIDESQNSELWVKVNSLALKNECCAIGESGLDRLKNSENFHHQKSFLIRHIELANALSKPLIIHLVRSSSDLLEILKQNELKVSLMVHDCMLNKEERSALIKLHPNTFFSFSPRVLRTPEKLENLDLNFLGLETDESSAEELEKLFITICKKLSLTSDDLLKILKSNFQQLFKN